MTLKVLMVVPDPMVEGGIAAVTSGYYSSQLEERCEVTYVQSYCDGSKLTKLVKALKAYKEYRYYINHNHYDVVHIHSSFGPSFYRKTPFIVWAHRKNIAIVNHIHGAEFGPFYENASERKRRLVRKVYGLCDQFIVLSAEWRDRIATIVPADRIHIVPNYSAPIDIQTAENLWAHRKSQVLFLGEIGQRKGAYDLPDIIRGVRSVMPEVRFVIAGSGDIDGVKSRLHPSDIESVSFPGWVRGEQKQHLLEDSSLYLLPSYNEGLPMSILDAMGYALPIVSTNVGGIPQLVSEENGALAEPGDTATLANGIVDILQHRAQPCGMRSLAIVNERYSLNAHINSLIKVYEIAVGLR